MSDGKKHFCSFLSQNTVPRCRRQQSIRRSAEDCRRKRSGYKERQIFGGLSYKHNGETQKKERRVQADTATKMLAEKCL